MPKKKRARLGPPIPGIEWVNLVTSHDHNVRNTDGTFFCEIHLQINLGSRETFNRLNSVLSVKALSERKRNSKLDRVKEILKQELARADRDNVSTLAMVEAIKLR